jgi:nitrate/nitrite transporter NarK
LNKRIDLKIASASVIVVATAFVWYLLAFHCLESLLNQISASHSDTLLIIGINTGSIAISGLISTLIVEQLKERKQFLYLWLSSGVLLSFLPLVLDATNLTQIGIISALFGAYFGLGMPATMGYHSSFTNFESRAKIGGFTFLILGATFAITGLVKINSLFETCAVLAIVLLVSLVIFHFIHAKAAKKLPPKDAESKAKYTGIITNKSFILYFIPWGMFTLINFLTIPVQNRIYLSPEDATLFQAIEALVTALVAVITGLVADRWGRKRLTIIGFIMLGIGYAIIGLFSTNATTAASIVFTITDGVAWGIFYVLFLFTLWGDLAQNQQSDKYYFLGAFPYLSAHFMQSYLTPYLSGSTSLVQPETIFSFASVFLFVAVLPLIYAPETLPEKNMKDRELKTYIQKAQKIVQKEDNKKNKLQTDAQEEQGEEVTEENSEEYEKAKELAEKYY